MDDEAINSTIQKIVNLARINLVDIWPDGIDWSGEQGLEFHYRTEDNRSWIWCNDHKLNIRGPSKREERYGWHLDGSSEEELVHFCLMLDMP